MTIGLNAPGFASKIILRNNRRVALRKGSCRADQASKFIVPQNTLALSVPPFYYTAHI
jgi:hypothetical protein